MKTLRGALEMLWRRLSAGRQSALEVAGVAAIAAAGWTINEGWGLLVVGVYLVLAAHSGTRGG